MCFGLSGDASGGVCSAIWVIGCETEGAAFCSGVFGVYDTLVYILEWGIALLARDISGN